MTRWASSSRSSYALRDDYTVFTATSGEEGLGILEREEIDLVIVDEWMPAMRGVEFLERADRDPAAPIRMLITGHDRSRVVIARDQRRPHLSLHREAVGDRRPAART